MRAVNPPMRPLQHGQNVTSLHINEIDRGTGFTGGRRRREEVRVDLNGGRPRENHRSFNDILKFTHVARPGVPAEPCHRFMPQHQRRLLQLGPEMFEKVPREQRDILRAFTEWRQNDRKDVQAVIEIGPEPPLTQSSRKISVRGRNDADVDRHWLRTAYAVHQTVFQYSQEFGLGLQRHLADFVKK